MKFNLWLILILIISYSVVFADIDLWLSITTIDENSVDVNLYARSTTSDLDLIDAVQWAITYNESENIPSTSLEYDFASDWGPAITIQSFTLGSYDHIISWMGFKGSDKFITSASGGSLLATIRFSKVNGSWNSVHIVSAEEGAGYGCGIANNTILQTLNYPEEDTSLPVQLSSFTAEEIGGYTVLTWTTESEVNVLGFNIYRSNDNSTQFININTKIINAVGSSPIQHIYQYVDKSISSPGIYYYRLECVDRDGSRELSHPISIIRRQVVLPVAYNLSPNYPNPFNSRTRITYHLPKSDFVLIRIFGLLGQEICTLVNEEVEAGSRFIHWNGRDGYGNEMASGIYMLIMEAGDFIGRQKMIIVR